MRQTEYDGELANFSDVLVPVASNEALLSPFFSSFLTSEFSAENFIT